MYNRNNEKRLSKISRIGGCSTQLPPLHNILISGYTMRINEISYRDTYTIPNRSSRSGDIIIKNLGLSNNSFRKSFRYFNLLSPSSPMYTIKTSNGYFIHLIKRISLRDCIRITSIDDNEQMWNSRFKH